MKKSKPIALGRHDIHALLDLIGGYGAVVAVGIIATLSVCAAFFIYRSVKAQRGKRCGSNGNETSAETEEGSSARRRERGDQPTGSTGDIRRKCVSDSRDGVELLSTSDISLPTEPSERDLNESTLKDLKEITDELLTELEPEAEDRADSDLDQSMEIDPDTPEDNMEREDHIELGDAGRESVGDICRVLSDIDVQFQQLDWQHETGESVREETEEHLKDHEMKSETGLSVDTDEPSETESAQEIFKESHQDALTCKPQDDLLGHAFTKSNSSSDHTVDDSKIQCETHHKTSAVKQVDHDWRFARTNDFDCCCHEKKTNVTDKLRGQPCVHCGSLDMEINHQHHSSRSEYNKPPQQNCLGFHTGQSLISGSSTQVSLSPESEERKADEGASMQKKHEKNEISIMDAIMDNNEWLHVGGPELRDLPWFTPTSAGACLVSVDETHTNEGNEELMDTVGQLKDSSEVKDEEKLASRKVGTVQPLPQAVQVTFRVHYITHSSRQLVAVTGDLQELGAWESFVPLHRAKDGFWANTITLPMESQVEWKFILVEDGKIRRWEECGNRCLVVTSQDEELYLDKCWGC